VPKADIESPGKIHGATPEPQHSISDINKCQQPKDRKDALMLGYASRIRVGRAAGNGN